MNDVMEGWSDFYTLIGSTAATLIGLIFVVISLGADHAKKGDEHRLRVGLLRERLGRAVPSPSTRTPRCVPLSP